MKFQKWLCLVLLIVGALVILYAVLYKTGMIAALGTLCNKPFGEVTTSTGMNGQSYTFERAQLFYDSDGFNTTLLWLGVGSVLAACLLYIFACHKRRNYYITNYIVTIVVAAFFLAVAVTVIVVASSHLSECNAILKDEEFMAEWKWRATESLYQDTTTYSENTGMFVFGFILSAIQMIGAVFLVLNMLWKMKLMKGEKNLLSKTYAEEVA
ncbi:MAG: DUF2700 domain-containing protein [Bacteroidales bacterium]|nr:DUF2700 domain-containing protein [Bacteroidales bacterium]